MIIIGVVGIVTVGLIFLGAVARFALLPRLVPMAKRFGSGVGSWVVPPPRREVALARAQRQRR